mmetsp:Transcript_8448/g.15910  ORF Transcript_8448/g.15910 Transcript_8448/m.15910 type:complete len:198 (-) Transcript_8448:251-844(-)
MASPSAATGHTASRASGSSRVLRAALSDPGPDPILPPWLGALAAAEAEDEGVGSLQDGVVPSGVATECGSNSTDPLVTTVGNVLEPLPLDSRHDAEGVSEQVKSLEHRVQQLSLALRRSEASRERERQVLLEGPGRIVQANDCKTCCVCMAVPRECAFTPCGHRCVCRLCGITVVRVDRRCPICRTTVGRLMRIVDP